ARLGFTGAGPAATFRVMDLGALRISGIVVSGALIGGAALFAMSARAPTRSPRPQAPAIAALQQPAAPAAFAISLRGDGPLARAQRLAMRGSREAAARRRVERELLRQRAFAGLCFDRFTPRGDIVVRACEGTLRADWQARLRAMPALTNVDP